MMRGANGGEHFIHQFTQTRIGAAFATAISRRVLSHEKNVPAVTGRRQDPGTTNRKAVTFVALVSQTLDGVPV